MKNQRLFLWDHQVLFLANHHLARRSGQVQLTSALLVLILQPNLSVLTAILPQAIVPLVHKLCRVVSREALQAWHVMSEMGVDEDKKILNSSSIIFEKDAGH